MLNLYIKRIRRFLCRRLWPNYWADFDYWCVLWNPLTSRYAFWGS